MVRDIPFLLWFLLVIFGLFLLHWRSELPCQDKLPEFHCTPILGCIRVLWLVFHPLGLRLDKALCGWNFVKHNYNKIPREISWIFFCYSPLVVGVLIHFISYFYFLFHCFPIFLVVDLKSLFLFLGLPLLVLGLYYP